MEPKAIEDVLVVHVSQFFPEALVCENGSSRTQFGSPEPEYPLRLILILVPTCSIQRVIGPIWIRFPFRCDGRRSVCWFMSSSCGLARIASASFLRSADLVLNAVCDIRAPVDCILGGKKPGTEVYDSSVTVTMGWISATVVGLPGFASKRAAKGELRVVRGSVMRRMEAESSKPLHDESM